MGLLSWVFVGLVAGALAKLILPGDQPGGCIVTILLGVVGALVGGWLMSLFGFGGVSGFNLYSVLTATAGAVVFLLLWALIAGRR